MTAVLKNAFGDCALEMPSSGLFSTYLNAYGYDSELKYEQKKQNDVALIRIYQTKIDSIMPIAYQATSQYIAVADDGVVNLYARKQDCNAELIYSFKIPYKAYQLLISEYLLTTIACTRQEIHVYYYQRNLTGKYFKVRQVLYNRSEVALLLAVHSNGVDNAYDDRENEADALFSDGSILYLLRVAAKVSYTRLLQLAEPVVYMYAFKLQGVVFSDVPAFKTSTNQEYTLLVWVQLQSCVQFFAFGPNLQLFPIKKQLEISSADQNRVCCSYFQKDYQCLFLLYQNQLFQFYKIIAKSSSSISDLSLAKISQLTVARDLNYIDIRFLSDYLLLCFTSSSYFLMDPYRADKDCIIDEQSYPHFPFHKRAAYAVSQLSRTVCEIVGYDSALYLQKFELASLTERVDVLLQRYSTQLAAQLLLDECARKHPSMQAHSDVMLSYADKLAKVTDDPTQLACIIAKKYIDVAVYITVETISGRALLGVPKDESQNSSYYQYIRNYMLCVALLCAAFDITDAVTAQLQTEYTFPHAYYFAQAVMCILKRKQIAMATFTLYAIAQLAQTEITQIDLLNAFDHRYLKNYIVYTQNKQMARVFPAFVLCVALQCTKANPEVYAKQFFDPTAEYSLFTVIEQCIKNSNKMKEHLAAVSAVLSVLFTGKLNAFYMLADGNFYAIDSQEAQESDVSKYLLSQYLSQTLFVPLLKNPALFLEGKFVQTFSQAFLGYFAKTPQKIQIYQQTTTFVCLWFYVDPASALKAQICYVTSPLCDVQGLNNYIDMLKDLLFNKKSGIVLSGPNLTALLQLMFVCVSIVTSSRELLLVSSIYKLAKYCFDENQQTVTRQQPLIASLRTHYYAYILKAVLNEQESNYIKQLQTNLQEAALLADAYIDSAFCLELMPTYGVLTPYVFEFFTNIDLNSYMYDDFCVNALLGFLSIYPTSYICPQYAVQLIAAFLRDYEAVCSNSGVILLFKLLLCELYENYIAAFELLFSSAMQAQVKGMLLCKYLLIFEKVHNNVQKKYFSQYKLDQIILYRLEDEKQMVSARQVKIIEQFWVRIYGGMDKYELLPGDLLDILVRTYKHGPLNVYLLALYHNIDRKFMLQILTVLAINSKCDFSGYVELDPDLHARLYQLLFYAVGARLKTDVTNEYVLFCDGSPGDARTYLAKIAQNKQQYGQKIFGFLMEQLPNDQFLYLLESQARIHQVLLDDQTVLKFIDDKNTPPALSLKLLYLLNSHERLQNMLLERFAQLQQDDDNAALLEYMHLILKYFTERKSDQNAARFQKLLDIAYHIKDYETREYILQSLADLFSIQMSPPDCLKYFLDLFEQSTWGEAHYLIDKLIKRIDLTNQIRQELADIISFDVQITSGYRINFLRKGVTCELACVCGYNIDDAPGAMLHEEKVILQDNSVMMLKVKEESDATHFFACGHCCHQQCLDETKESLQKRAKCIEEVLVNGGDNSRFVHTPERIIYCPKCK